MRENPFLKPTKSRLLGVSGLKPKLSKKHVEHDVLHNCFRKHPMMPSLIGSANQMCMSPTTLKKLQGQRNEAEGEDLVQDPLLAFFFFFKFAPQKVTMMLGATESETLAKTVLSLHTIESLAFCETKHADPIERQQDYVSRTSQSTTFHAVTRGKRFHKFKGQLERTLSGCLSREHRVRTNKSRKSQSPRTGRKTRFGTQIPSTLCAIVSCCREDTRALSWIWSK